MNVFVRSIFEARIYWEYHLTWFGVYCEIGAPPLLKECMFIELLCLRHARVSERPLQLLENANNFPEAYMRGAVMHALPYIGAQLNKEY